MEKLIEVGTVRKTHGYRGEIKLWIEPQYEDDFSRARFYFIGHDERSALPYEMVNMRGSDLICRLEGVDSKEAAALLRGQRLYLKANDVSEDVLTKDNKGEGTFHRFIGYALIDTERGEIGAIGAIDETEYQSLAAVEYQGREIIVPLNHDLIRGVDFTKKIVFVGLPEGLLDL